MVTENGRARMLTARMLAEILGISTARIYALAAEGILPCCRLGRTVLFEAQQIEEFIRSGGASWEHGWRKKEPK